MKLLNIIDIKNSFKFGFVFKADFDIDDGSKSKKVKEKYFLTLGVDKEKNEVICLIINSEINENIYRETLEQYEHIPIKPNQIQTSYQFTKNLTNNISYINPFQIKLPKNPNLDNLSFEISNKLSIKYVGSICDIELLEKIKIQIVNSGRIKPKILKKCGFIEP